MPIVFSANLVPIVFSANLEREKCSEGTDESFERLRGATVFSKIDMKTSLHQNCLKQQDMGTAELNSKYGELEYLVMLMGAFGALVTLDALMIRRVYYSMEEFLMEHIADLLKLCRELETCWNQIKTFLNHFWGI